jgi:transposase-like protein
MPRTLTDLVPIRLSARRRWRAKEARAILKHLDTSGLSVREFAARYGLETQRLYRWRAQLASPGPAAAPPFVEIERSPGVAIEVVLRSGHVRTGISRACFSVHAVRDRVITSPGAAVSLPWSPPSGGENKDRAGVGTHEHHALAQWRLGRSEMGAYQAPKSSCAGGSVSTPLAAGGSAPNPPSTNGSSVCGGGRAEWKAGGAEGSPRFSRMRVTDSVDVTATMISMRLPQRPHSRTSFRNTRQIRDTHGTRRGGLRTLTSTEGVPGTSP